ncbi:MAG: endonuclease [Myxococcota bacterium]
MRRVTDGSAIRLDQTTPFSTEARAQPLGRSGTVDDMVRVRGSNPAYFDEAGQAKAIEKYYAGATPAENRSDPHKALSRLLESTHTNRLDYREARHHYLYPIVDVHPDGKLRGVYTGISYDPPELRLSELTAEYRFGDRNPAVTDRDAGMANAVDGTRNAVRVNPRFNCEHSVPQSWFKKKLPMKADLHCLFTADPDCNGMRGNKTFDESGDERGVPCGVTRGDRFEPARNKGAVARATLYFLVRYPGIISRANLPEDSIDELLRWHHDDPPSVWEKHRTQEIEKAQGNRNPFIDHPDWADAIDFSRGLKGGRR